MDDIHLFFTGFSWKEIVSSFWVLFAVIDMLGSVPLIINLKKRAGEIHAHTTTVAVGIIMFTFLFVGKDLLAVFSVDVASFSVTGSIILAILGLEMILDINIFKTDFSLTGASIIPLAFPIIIDASPLVMLLALKLEYAYINIICAILANLLFMYIVIHYSQWIERKLGKLLIGLIQKVMGIVLLSIAVALFRTYLFAPVC